jgi:hypothetical protein
MRLRLLLMLFIRRVELLAATAAVHTDHTLHCTAVCHFCVHETACAGAQLIAYTPAVSVETSSEASYVVQFPTYFVNDCAAQPIDIIGQW